MTITSRCDLFGDVLDDPRVGGGSRRQHRDVVGQCRDEITDASSIGSEVVAPVGDAVSLVNDEHPEASDDLLIFSCGVAQLQIAGLPLNHLTPAGQPAVMSAGDSYDDIRQLFFQMWQHLSSKKPYASEVGNSLLHVLLLLCRGLWSESRAPQVNTTAELGQKIKDYIDAHYKQEFTFEAITSALKMNRFYLAHVFKDFCGYSPKQYQTRRRIGEAQSLLLSTRMGVTEVANAVGYDNVNNFHRIFQNLVGIPPARYKKFWLTGQLKSPES